MARRSTLTRTAVVAVVLALSLVAAACGSSSKGTSSTATTQPAPTGTPLKIGWIGTVTSATVSGPNAGQDGMDTWGKSTNDHGGIAGHPVQVVAYADDKADPAVGLAAVKDMVENQHVIAIVGSIA